MRLLYHFCMLYDCGRLDSTLTQVLGISRSQISQWIEEECVKIAGKSAKKSHVVKARDCIEIYKKEKDSMQKIQEIPSHIEIIHENDDYIIFNKPRDLVVHHAPSVKGATLTDYLQANNFALSTMNGENRFGIVHRLDKDTSGAILVAKNNKSHLRFAEMLQKREMGRIYICVITKPLPEDSIVECFMGRNPHNRLKMAQLDKNRFPNARDSKSAFYKIQESDTGIYELVGVRLFSGRTHQIRVHLSTLNRYIYGDTLYSPENLSAKYTTKMLLHATLLYFEGMVFSAKMPKDLLKFLDDNFTDYKGALEKFLSQWKIRLQND